jgi:hypothetical protein
MAIHDFQVDGHRCVGVQLVAPPGSGNVVGACWGIDGAGTTVCGTGTVDGSAGPGVLIVDGGA